MEAGGSLRRQSSLVADSLRGAPSHLVDPATGPNRGGQNWGNSVIESGEIPLILVRVPGETSGFVGVKRPLRRKAARVEPVRQKNHRSLPRIRPKEDPWGGHYRD